MQNEFQKRFCWGVLITYSSIVFFGELIHAIPGMECHGGCTSGHECTSGEHATCSPQPVSSSRSISNNEQSSNLAHCIFCKIRSRKSTAMECSAAVSAFELVRAKNRMAICKPAELCQVCKLMAGFSSSMLQYSETTPVSELFSFAFFGENQLSSNSSAAYSPRGPPRHFFL